MVINLTNAIIPVAIYFYQSRGLFFAYFWDNERKSLHQDLKRPISQRLSRVSRLCATFSIAVYFFPSNPSPQVLFIGSKNSDVQNK